MGSWDHHRNLKDGLARNCEGTDKPIAGLLKDLKQRGLLDDTLVIWGGEFGRTVYCQGKLTQENYGRDHHPNCFTYWMAGGGVRGGTAYGSTDELGYNAVDPIFHVHDFHATILHLLGLNHKRLSFYHNGIERRLTDVHGHVIEDVLA